MPAPASPVWRVVAVVLAAFGLGAVAALSLNAAEGDSSASPPVTNPASVAGVPASTVPATTSPTPAPAPEATAPTTATTTVPTTATSSAPATPATSVTLPATLPVPAGTAAAPAVDAAAYVVFDSSTGQLLASSNADEPRPVGSLIKLLNAYVVMQAGEPERIVTVPEMQVDPKESQIGLYAGEQLSREVLLRAMLIVSANDAARALATDVGGSIDGFVGQMNDAAAALGMAGTEAKNPVGLDAEGQQSTANDVLLLARTLMTDETFRATVARSTAALHGMTFTSPNDLLTSYPGADGIKTGHTTTAGYCLAASATRDGRQVFVVVLGSPTKAARVGAASTLLDWAFAQPA